MGFCTCSTAGRILSAEKKYERTTARRIRRRFNTKEKRKRDNTKESESEREKERIIKNVSQKEKEKKKKLHVLRARVALYQQREKHTKKERVICNNTLQK